MTETPERLEVHFGLRLTPSFADRLHVEAEKRSVNLAALTRRLLEERLRAWEEEDRPQQGA